MKKREQLEPFSLSFLDVISCGFGAVVMLVLIFKPQTESVEIQEKPSSSSFELVSKVLALTELKEELLALIQGKASTESTVDMVSESLKASLDRAKTELESSKSEIEKVKQRLSAMSSKVETVKKAALSQGKKEKLDDEVDRFAMRMTTVPLNQLAMQKILINQAVESSGLLNSQKFATIFDGISRHSLEGLNFKKMSEEYGWKKAVKERDNGTYDWTKDRPSNQ